MSAKALQRAIDLVGRQAIADACNCSPDNVSNWLRRGGVPAQHCFAVAKLLDWAVTMHELNPDAFPIELYPASHLPGYQPNAAAVVPAT